MRRLNPLDAPHRFYRSIKVDEMKCWVWQSCIKKNGYGTLYLPGMGTRNAHRALYEIMVGPVDDGLELDHLCRNRSCVNPDHLEPVTGSENQRRGMSPAGYKARQTHCKRGHRFTEKNTRRNKKGNRTCRICDAARKRSQRRGEVFQ